MNMKRRGDKFSLPMIWPITKERYKQVLMKMRRQYEEIHNLRLEIMRLKEELERYE